MYSELFSHSMGGAFSEGIIRYLKEQGWNVDFSIHLNTWLPSEFDGLGWNIFD